MFEKKRIVKLESELELAKRELAFVRDEHDRERAGLVHSVKTTFEADMSAKLRLEHQAERRRYTQRKNQLTKLIQAAKQTIPEYARLASTPDIPAEQALVLLRRAIEEADEVVEQLAGPTTEQLAEEFAIGKKRDWPPESGKVYRNPYQEQVDRQTVET